MGFWGFFCVFCLFFVGCFVFVCFCVRGFCGGVLGVFFVCLCFRFGLYHDTVAMQLSISWTFFKL